MQISPIGHIAHVSGFFYGVVAYYVFQEVYRPGGTKVVVENKRPGNQPGCLLEQATATGDVSRSQLIRDARNRKF